MHDRTKERFRRVLTDDTADVRKRQKALKYLIHFVATCTNLCMLRIIMIMGARKSQFNSWGKGLTRSVINRGTSMLCGKAGSWGNVTLTHGTTPGDSMRG